MQRTTQRKDQSAPDVVGRGNSLRAIPDDSRALARIATRAEVRQPGIMERALGGAGMGMAGSLLTSFAAGFVGSMVAQSFFSALDGFGGEVAADDEITAENDPDAGQEDVGDDGGGNFEV